MIGLGFSQSAQSSLSPLRLLTESCAGVESSEPCRTSSTDRRVVALPHRRWEGTTEPYAPPIWRRCRLPLAILPVCALIPDGTEIVTIERHVPAVWSAPRDSRSGILRALTGHDFDLSPSGFRYTCELTGQYHMPFCLTPDRSNGRRVLDQASAYSAAAPPKRL
jgi:hypothetical protein